MQNGKTVISNLREIGHAVLNQERDVCGLLSRMQPASWVNQQAPEFWRLAVQELSDEEVAAVARGLTYVEAQLGWLGGSVAGSIWLFRILIDRGTSRELLDQLSAWILEQTSNSYSPFGTMITLGAKDYSQYIERAAVREERIAECVARDRRSEAIAASERSLRSRRAANCALDRGKDSWQMNVSVLSNFSVAEQLAVISQDDTYPPQFFPTCIADAATVEVIAELPLTVQLELASRLKGKRRGPWGSFKKRLLGVVGPGEDRAAWDI